MKLNTDKRDDTGLALMRLLLREELARRRPAKWLAGMNQADALRHALEAQMQLIQS